MKKNTLTSYLNNFIILKKSRSSFFKEELHWKASEESNSIAIIIKHLNGNTHSRWTDFLTTDGEKPNRNRDQEFIATI
ncbi:DUF1572 family protein [Pueribacillus sp. YX66]|uniref:DUF1572 family protein n=1 Tax=Pueribacillus sp. YX66 TaxID=3229242 RepID=UPI0036D27050